MNALSLLQGGTRCPGAWNPYERFGASRYGAALLDLIVGEPVAYATGSPELKSIGPSRTGSNSPIIRSQRGIVCSSGTVDVAPSRPQSDENRIDRAIAAHRSYLRASSRGSALFTQWNVTSADRAAREDLVEIAGQAEAENERWRVTFRDLTAELGYIPRGEGIALPDQEQGCECPEPASATALPSQP